MAVCNPSTAPGTWSFATPTGADGNHATNPSKTEQVQDLKHGDIEKKATTPIRDGDKARKPRSGNCQWHRTRHSIDGDGCNRKEEWVVSSGGVPNRRRSSRTQKSQILQASTNAKLQNFRINLQQEARQKRGGGKPRLGRQLSLSKCGGQQQATKLRC